MALHTKLGALSGLQPDIAIVSESAQPEVLLDKAPGFRPSGHVWAGRTKHKGLGVLSFGPYRVELDASHRPDNEIVLPIRVSGPVEFNLLAVFAYNNRGESGRRLRVGPVLRALEDSATFCAEDRPLVVAGDFNNHIVWDRPGKANNMAGIFAALEGRGLVSAYHWSRRVALGEEPDPTIFWRDRREDGPRYHIDYIFIPRVWAENGLTFSIGGFGDWIGSGLSDHVPLTVDTPAP